MDTRQFRKDGHDLINFIADYFEQIEYYPVKPGVNPGEIFNRIEAAPPDDPEDFPDIMVDFEEIIMPGMTHWQSPKFFAYFPANNSLPSILAELLTSGIGAQCMSWETSPAATELEEKMMIWLRDMCGLPESWHGVIQDTASTATLCSLLTAREKALDFEAKSKGAPEMDKFTVYASKEAHSSIDKAVRIIGIGTHQLRKIEVDDNYALIPEKLIEKIENDIKNGYKPLAVIGCLGTTGSTAVDPLEKIGKIAKKNNLWYHVDAAYAGSALLLPEFRKFAVGIEMADSYVFNPHKWLLTNFDCSAYFVKDKYALINTFSILPEYLKTKEDDHVNNYRDWGIQLGRRFRALKLWFVIRSYGVKGLQDMLRKHIELGKYFEEYVKNTNGLELLAPRQFNLVCFRYNPGGVHDETLNRINKKLLNAINNKGRVFLTHTSLNGRYAIRMVCGSRLVEKSHIDELKEIIAESIDKIVHIY
ncbi:MAG: pyridoxal phosphate-dependent decarboxylase family protein [Candidatus Kapaibacterium sp.]